jgi:hypothetical protein
VKRNGTDQVPETIFDSLKEIPLPDKERQAAQRAAFLARARNYRKSTVSVSKHVRHKRGGLYSPRVHYARRRPAMLKLAAAIAIVLALVAGTGGVVYAADGAVPGDPLYGVDQAVESVRLNLAADPQATTELLLAFAEERLLEASELPGKENEYRRQVALSHYGETISSLARTLTLAEEKDRATLTARVDQAFTAQEDALTSIFEDEGDGGRGKCDGKDSHPAAYKLAESFGTSHDDVMAMFCSGYGLGEIMHALKTSQETGVSPQDLLATKTQMGGWGQVWQAYGLIGRPEHAPVGPPDDRPVGPPDDRPVGPPDDRPVGPPDGRPVGPPDDRPVGPPDGRPVGPPDDRPVGPPDDRPVGPPGD